MALLLDELLPVELTNGNDGRGSKWFRSAKVREEMELILSQHRRTPFSCRTRVVVTRILGPGQRLWDSSSILRGNWKEIEDALVCLGWWIDDGPRWIVKTEGEQDATRRDEGPAVRVQVYSTFPENPVRLSRRTIPYWR